ncbi:MAG: hypothetical protein ACHREM_31950 [Polyangiales bacterium]
MTRKIHHSDSTRNLSPLETMVREIARDEARRMLADLARSRLARLHTVGLTPKQIPLLEAAGVNFEKPAKYWLVDLASFEAHLARQRVERATKPPNDREPDPFADLDPIVASNIRRAAGGSR